MTDLGPLGERLVGLVEAPGFPLVAVALALLAGAAHALAPGHGKSLAAAYLLGANARARDALLLGGTVAVMHTATVLVLAVAWTGLSGSTTGAIGPVSRVLQVLAGLLVLAAGIGLVARLRRGHRHADHAHDHHHDVRPGAVLLGAAGGLVPAPSAFLVMVAGAFSGRSGLAVVLVVCFGAGMAVVLSAAGLVTLTGRDVVARSTKGLHLPLLGRATAIGPAVAAWGVLAAGAVLTVLAVAG